MALTQRLELRQGQSLVMTPQLQQAIKLLQMSNLELQSFVEAELERNPLLERDERREAGQEGDAVAGPAAGDATKSDDAPADPQDIQTRGAVGTAESGWASLRPSRGMTLDVESDFGATLTREKTLAEHLTEQLALAVTDPADRLIAQHLVGMVNDAGYLTGDCTAVAEMLGASSQHVERILGVLQGCDPAGVFARDLKECLALQLKDRNRLDPAMSALIDNIEL